MASARRGRFRTKLCRNFALGHCPQGDNCNYIHASPDTIQSNHIGPILQSSISQRSSDGPLSASTFSPPLWPTLSPATNTSSDQIAYTWSNSSNTGSGASHIKYRPLSWRTTLCRHFLKNRGWCPVGDDCNYIHDLTLADFAKDDVRLAGHRSSAIPGKHGERSKAGTKHSHCWAYVQGLCHVPDCQYLHPVAVQMFAAHTPCLAWPNCRRGPLCPYKHPEPYISNSPSTSPKLSVAPAQQQTLPLSQPDTIPRGAVPWNGMFYFGLPPQAPAPGLQLSIPPSQAPRMPVTSPPSLPHVIFTNPWEVWQLPYTSNAPMYPQFAANQSAWPGARFGEPNFGQQQQPPSTVPQLAVPRPIRDEMPQVRPQTSNYPYPSAEDAAKTRAFSTPGDEFPYVPPKEQRSGHARRISVTLKSKADLDALGLDSNSRLPWQTHSDRLARRSWAPSSSSLRAAQGTPPPMMYGL